MSERVFQHPAALTTNDTLIVFVFIAAIIHTLILLGVNYKSPEPAKSHKSIAITLVTQKAKKAPKKAEFLAQSNQIGAGKKHDKPTPAAQKIASSGTKSNKQPQQKIIKQQSAARKQLLTQQVAEQKIHTSQKSKKNSTKSIPKLSMDALRRQVSELGAKIRYKKPSSNQNRIKFVNSVSAHKYLAAQYVTDWQRKIENMGNLNYPAVAKRPGFSSSLIMIVAIKADGSIYSLQVNKSSGYPVLDDAAKRIVRLSAPFPPLPKALLQELDILVITRIWKFSDETGLRTR